MERNIYKKKKKHSGEMLNFIENSPKKECREGKYPFIQLYRYDSFLILKLMQIYISCYPLNQPQNRITI